MSHCTSTKSVRPLIYPHISFGRLDFSHKHLKNIWKVGGQRCLVTLELYTHFWSKDLSKGLACLYLLSYYEVFSHLRNGQLIPCENGGKFNLENKAQFRKKWFYLCIGSYFWEILAQIHLANLVMGQAPFYQTSIKLKHHLSKIERVHLLVIELELPNFGF